MKTVYIKSDMSMRERTLEVSRVIGELEDNEPFTSIEELTPEKLRDQMQGAIDAFQAYDLLKTKIVSVKLDHERDLIVIETLINPEPEEE